MIKRVYIAGAYSDNNVLGVLRNIGRGQDVAAEVFSLGFAPFCPWFDKEFIIAHWWEEFTVQRFLDYSIVWLDVSDCMLVVPNVKGLKDWQQSAGTMKEIEYAKIHNIPVFHSILELKRHYK